MISRDFAVTHFRYADASWLAAALYEEGRLSQLEVRPFPDPSIIGNVYLGKVESAKPEIGGCFVRIGEETCFLSDRSFKAGTELLVQVTKEMTGRKQPCVSSALSLTGAYVTAEEGKSGWSYSRRLSEEAKERLSMLSELDPGFRLIVRTSAEHASLQQVQNEAEVLTGTIRALREREKTRTVYSLLYTPPAFYTEMLFRLRTVPERIITDDPTALAELRSRAPSIPSEYYDDPYPLASLFNLSRDIERLLSKTVHLKSGADLVIEQTEAFASIDVNSGKTAKKKEPESTYLAVNMEAAKEAARQIRLRSLSGIILIDFINLKKEEDRKALLSYMREQLQQDPGYTEAVDITPLGIMEIVRKRTQKTLAARLLS